MNKEFSWFYDVGISEFKSLEINVTRFAPTKWFDFHFHWPFKGDHCGPKLFLEIYGFGLSVDFYDHRHWAWQFDRFYAPGEELLIAQTPKLNIQSVIYL